MKLSSAPPLLLLLLLPAILISLACALAAPPEAMVVIQQRPEPPQPRLLRRRLPEPALDPYERRCVMQGGVCRPRDDCPPGQLTSMRGLCPLQQARSVECCYARPSPRNMRSWGKRHNNKKHWRRYWKKQQKQ